MDRPPARGSVRQVPDAGTSFASAPSADGGADRVPAAAAGLERRTRHALVALALLVYAGLGPRVDLSDSRPARYLPLVLLEARSLHFDHPFIDAATRRPGPQWLVTCPDGHRRSVSPMVLPAVLTPLYVPAWLVVRRAAWRPEVVEAAAEVMERAAAALVAALAVGLLHRLLVRRGCGPREALGLTLVFAFGTSTWTTSARALWQHGLAEVLGLVALNLLVGRPSGGRALAFGAAAGLLCANRPQDLLVALPLLGLAAATWPAAPLRARALAAFAAVGVATVGLNLALYGHAVGGYHIMASASYLGQRPRLEGALALLVSPGKGLLVFTPFLLVLPAALVTNGWRQADGFVAAALAATAGVALLHGGADLCGGVSYGSRYLTDALPLLFAAVARWRPDAWGVPPTLAWGAAVASLAAQAVGLFCYPWACTDDLLYRSASAVWTVPVVVLEFGSRSPLGRSPVLAGVALLGLVVAVTWITRALGATLAGPAPAPVPAPPPASQDPGDRTAEVR